MRKVIFKEWIEAKFENNTKVMGTGCYGDEYTGSGLFHGWGFNYEEFSEGVGNYSIAIIERSTGEVVEIFPRHVKFID